MKSTFLSLTLLFACALVSLGQDKDSIQSVIQKAYIDGIQNGGESAAIRKGFHPSFAMLRLMDNNINPLPIEEWIKNLEKNKLEKKQNAKVTGKFVNIDVTGNNAVAKLELYREGKQIFTDYLVLYKFTEGWRIVSKTYFRH